MSAPENIETFNRICITLFDKLYSKFLAPIDLNMNDVSMCAVQQDAEQEVIWNVLSMGGHVIRFLSEEGFLTYKWAALEGSGFGQVRLTMKGLAVLGYVPMEKKEPLISTIRHMAGSGLKEAGSESVRQIVTQIFSLALAATPTISSLVR